MALRKRRWGKLMLCSMALGGLWRLQERYALTAMGGYNLKIDNPALERRFWDVFPSDALRFWPLYVCKSRDMGNFLEKTLPVRVDTRMTGVGTFATHITALSPWVIVEWKGQKWCVSREGRMWNLVDSGAQVNNLKIPQKPLWRVVSSPDMIGVDERPLPSGVFPVLFPVAAMEEFLLGFSNSPWFNNVEEIVLGRRENANLFTIRFLSGGQEFLILLQKGKYEELEFNFALENILDRLRKEGGNHVIDATYKNRIVVRTLSADAREGGSK